MVFKPITVAAVDSNGPEPESEKAYMDAFVAKLAAWWAGTSTTEMVWLTIGFTAQLMFSMRFILQWIASERAKQSIVPEVFWYFSFAGGTMLFAYAIYRVDPVFIMGQGTGLLIYARNIHFIWKDKQAANKDGSSQKVAAE